MKQVSRLDFVRSALKKRVGKLKLVAAESGVAYTTVKNIAAKVVHDPRGSNLDKLYEYLSKAA